MVKFCTILQKNSKSVPQLVKTSLVSLFFPARIALTKSCLKRALEKAVSPSHLPYPPPGSLELRNRRKEKKTKRLLLRLLLLPVRAALRPRSRGYRTSAHPNRDGSGATSACASTDARGWDPCGSHTCGSLPRMQSIAADCAPMARILHHIFA